MRDGDTVTCPWCSRQVPTLADGRMFEHRLPGVLREVCVGTYRWPWQHKFPSPTIGTAA